MQIDRENNLIRIVLNNEWYYKGFNSYRCCITHFFEGYELKDFKAHRDRLVKIEIIRHGSTTDKFCRVISDISQLKKSECGLSTDTCGELWEISWYHPNVKAVEAAC